MSVRAIEAEVSIKSGVSAECTIGREVIVEVHDDVTLDSLTVTANGQYEPSDGVDGFSDVSVNVEAPKDPNVIEGEFEATETGVLTIDTGYEGDSYPKIIIIYSVVGLIDISTFNAPRYALNAISYIKINTIGPTYPDEEKYGENQMRIAYVYKSSNAGFSSSSASPFVFTKISNEGVYGVANVLKMSDARHMRIFVADDGETIFLPTGVKYKYRVYY